MSQLTDDQAIDATEADDETASPSAAAVADYLTGHPEFFVEHADTLAGMAIPSRWSGDGVVDLQRYMVDIHRNEIDDLRNCAQEVIETSRSNMSTQTRTHAAVLSVLGVTEFERLVQVVTDDWPLLLDVDAVCIGFEPAQVPSARLVSDTLRPLAPGTADALLGEDEDVRLFRDMNDDGSLFGSAAGLVRSAALARLRPSRHLPAGMLAMGSRGGAFHPGQGTELIVFLARVLETTLHRIDEGAG